MTEKRLKRTVTPSRTRWNTVALVGAVSISSGNAWKQPCHMVDDPVAVLHQFRQPSYLMISALLLAMIARVAMFLFCFFYFASATCVRARAHTSPEGRPSQDNKNERSRRLFISQQLAKRKNKHTHTHTLANTRRHVSSRTENDGPGETAAPNSRNTREMECSQTPV